MIFKDVISLVKLKYEKVDIIEENKRFKYNNVECEYDQSNKLVFKIEESDNVYTKIIVDNNIIDLKYYLNLDISKEDLLIRLKEIGFEDIHTDIHSGCYVHLNNREELLIITHETFLDLFSVNTLLNDNISKTHLFRASSSDTYYRLYQIIKYIWNY